MHWLTVTVLNSNLLIKYCTFRLKNLSCCVVTLLGFYVDFGNSKNACSFILLRLCLLLFSSIPPTPYSWPASNAADDRFSLSSAPCFAVLSGFMALPTSFVTRCTGCWNITSSCPCSRLFLVLVLFVFVLCHCHFTFFVCIRAKGAPL